VDRQEILQVGNNTRGSYEHAQLKFQGKENNMYARGFSRRDFMKVAGVAAGAASFGLLAPVAEVAGGRCRHSFPGAHLKAV